MKGLDQVKHVEEIKFNYMYSDYNFHFIDPETFEQININRNIIGEKGMMLKKICSYYKFL